LKCFCTFNQTKGKIIFLCVLYDHIFIVALSLCSIIPALFISFNNNILTDSWDI
jgi:predicted membrane channel-forming protein YqfA (hemolysin III family)